MSEHGAAGILEVSVTKEEFEDFLFNTLTTSKKVVNEEGFINALVFVFYDEKTAVYEVFQSAPKYVLRGVLKDIALEHKNQANAFIFIAEATRLDLDDESILEQFLSGEEVIKDNPEQVECITFHAEGFGQSYFGDIPFIKEGESIKFLPIERVNENEVRSNTSSVLKEVLKD